MLSIRHILVPVDLADPSRQATDVAVEVGRAFDAKVTLLNVFDVSLFVFSGGPFMPLVDTTNELEKGAREATCARLAEAKAKYANVDAIVRCGQPWQEILTAIVEQEVDLVVMGTHGREGLPHALLGSVAERVVRMSPVPVWTIRTPR